MDNKQRAEDCYLKASMHLANANAAAEAGKREKAETSLPVNTSKAALNLRRSSIGLPTRLRS